MYRDIAISIVQAIENVLTVDDVLELLEKPKHAELGDLAFPCFILAKIVKKSPQQIAAEMAGKLECDYISRSLVVGGYVNIFLNQQQAANDILSMILQEQHAYGTIKRNRGKVVIDFSSPNIAKPFSMGHLRSTVIGQALANIAEKNGYKAVRINHLGDWGTQFGKLIVAYKRWGNPSMIEQSPIQELLKLYVKFHELAEQDERLNEQARAIFKALEDGDQESLTLWEWFREESLKEFKHIYDLLNIQFDSYAGEAFYNDKMDQIVQELTDKKLLTRSNGAYIVELENSSPCLIKKTDGATLYATRDLAAAMYRMETYKPEKIFYVVGNEQTLHFKQLFQVLDKMGYDWSKDLQHVPFGMMLKEGKKMSTRKGKVVLLANVLDEAVATAKKSIEEKNPLLENKDQIAIEVGVGAVIFNDLKNHRMNDIEFSLNQMMNFEGETGPYIQYACARIYSVLEKGCFSIEKSFVSSFSDEKAWPTIKLLDQFPNTLYKAYEESDPSQIAKFALLLARAFNKYYAHTKILFDDEGMQQRMAFSYCVAVVLEECLALLGMKAPKNM